MEQRVYGNRAPVSQRASREARSAGFRVRLLSAVNTMPPLPEALTKLLKMLNSDSVSATQVAAVIEGDGVLSGSVMRCVNSAYYGMARQVSSIRHAVALLGFQTVRNLALAFSMRRMMTGSAASRRLYSSYSRHALATALMTQNVAVRTGSDDLESAFAAGLFHDVGKLLVYTAAPEAVPKIVELWEGGDGSYEEAEEEVIETTHSELSAIVLEGWKLPAAICEAARYHHSPGEAAAARDQSGHSLAELVHAADLAVNFEGLRSPDDCQREPESPEPALRSLGLAGSIEDLRASFRAELEGFRELFP